MAETYYVRCTVPMEAVLSCPYFLPHVLEDMAQLGNPMWPSPESVVWSAQPYNHDPNGSYILTAVGDVDG